MSPSCTLADASATAHHHHLPPRHHSPLHASATVAGGGDFSLSPPVPLMALTPAVALCSPSLRPTAAEPRHLSTKEPPRQPLSAVPPAPHRSDGAIGGGGGVWRSKSHGGCFGNQHVAPCDEDDDDGVNDDGDDDKQQEEDGGDDWLVTYSRTSSSYSRPAPVAPASQPQTSVCATSHKSSYHAGNPLAFGAAVAAAAAAATTSPSASASAAATTTTNAEGNHAEEEEEEDFNAWMLSAEEAARSGGRGRNVTAGAKGGGKGGGATGVGQSQACGSRGATDGGPDGDESEWSAALTDPSGSDRRSSNGGRRRSSRLSASSRRRNAMEYSELDAIRERLLHATQLWAITVADGSTAGAHADVAAALAAAASAATATSPGAAAAAVAAASAVAVPVIGDGAAVEAQQVAQAAAASSAAGPGPSSSVATAATAVAAGRLSNAAAGNGTGKPRLSDDPAGRSDARRSGVFSKARSAASGTAATVTSRRSMSRSLSAAGFAAVTASEAFASAAILVAGGGAAPGKAAGTSTNLTVTLPGASSSGVTGASGIPDSTTPTGPTFTFGPTDGDDVSPTSAAAPSGTSSSSLSASAHGLACSGSSPPHVAESPFSRISTFLMRRFVSPFPIVRSSTYPVLR